MFTVDDAIRIARDAHEGQVDKSGRPYIGHPLRVMQNVDGEYERMTAVLHDVIEDTEVTAADLVAQGCPPEVVAAVVAISKVAGEDQETYLGRVAANPIALAVKFADIADNTSPDRLAKLDEHTQRRLRAKYTAALAFLGAS
ncbi:HD domain-containing protein [Actinokineospora alba]|uniref:HD domain-containing protein n=1 Tax=Actinokineospora alba TaxID=504798 RepID=A0A1H0K998_9PSEU|nr:HD domain-containing protein [Actinokineospora alba]TDP67999.1 HD domain-containing protein [Actinokineospora alba]SDH90456.1 HD domain-containing protein [Actinokineospora alba]SDO52291.1 HD domain-containing protein [Actinokineospora alba]